MADSVWKILTEPIDVLQGARSRPAARRDQATGEYQLDRPPSPEVNTAVSREQLEVINEYLLTLPDGFTVHPKLARQLDQRRDAIVGDGGRSTGLTREALAFASLLTEGIPIRLTGQDSERGTFTSATSCCMTRRPAASTARSSSCRAPHAPMELHNSPLSEMACLGFEFGYSQEGPETLVLWEAQFGDFANGAQVMIDQFIAPGLAKWGQTAPDAAAAAWLRGIWAGALLCARSSASCSSRRRATSASPT